MEKNIEHGNCGFIRVYRGLGFPKLGEPFGGPHNLDRGISGCIVGSP